MEEWRPSLQRERKRDEGKSGELVVADGREGEGRRELEVNTQFRGRGEEQDATVFVLFSSSRAVAEEAAGAKPLLLVAEEAEGGKGRAGCYFSFGGGASSHDSFEQRQKTILKRRRHFIAGS